MNSELILTEIRKQANPANVAGMARFGINSKNTLGVSVTFLRGLAKEIKKNETSKVKLHAIASELWESSIHEARILATLIDDPELVDTKQLDNWVNDLDSWDVCDALCMNLVDKTSFAFSKAKSWVEKEEEFTRRAGFSLIATLALHRHNNPDSDYEIFFRLIEKYSTDERNFVKKAVNWALRQLGKRNEKLLLRASALAQKMLRSKSKTARWIAKDALKEFERKKWLRHLTN